jgi:hypothetical protein
MRRVFRAAVMLVAVVASSSFAAEVEPDAGVPQGWFFAGAHPGAYESGVGAGACGARSIQLRSVSAEAVEGKNGSVMQLFRADNYRGKRVRFSGVTSTTDVRHTAGLWMRVDGADKKTLAFDNMQTRPLVGNTACVRNSVVLDVPTEAQFVALGVVVEGQGQVELADIAFEVVDASVASTDVLHPKISVSPARTSWFWSDFGERTALPRMMTQSVPFTARWVAGAVEVGGLRAGRFTVTRENGLTTIEGTWGPTTAEKPVRIDASVDRVDMKWGALERHLRASDEQHAEKGCRAYRANDFTATDTMNVCGEALAGPLTPEVQVDLVAQFLSAGFAPEHAVFATRYRQSAPRDPPPQLVHGKPNLGSTFR